VPHNFFLLRLIGPVLVIGIVIIIVELVSILIKSWIPIFFIQMSVVKRSCCVINALYMVLIYFHIYFSLGL